MVIPMRRGNHQLRFLTGPRLLLFRLSGIATGIRYVVHRRDFPLFRFSDLARAQKAAERFGLRKVASVDGRHFSALTIPQYPSAAYDHMAAKGGLNLFAAGTPFKQQIDTAILAVTGRCEYHCVHCYERFNKGEEEHLSVDHWRGVIRELQAIGTNVIVLSGGEPMLRYDGVLELLHGADKDLSDFHLHTSGHGMTPARASELHKAGLTAAAVGLDDVDRHHHDRMRGMEGAYDAAISAIRWFNEAGILTYVNCCLSKEMIRSGRLWEYYELTRDLRVGFLQLLEPRPCGGYLGSRTETVLDAEEREMVFQFLREGSTQRRYRNYPIIYSVALTESPGEMGCRMGGLSHLSIDSRGNVNPCVFLPVTFGNITQERFTVIYERMRKAAPFPIHTECPALQLAAPIERQFGISPEMPVPYERIEREWHSLVCQGAELSQCPAGGEQAVEHRGRNIV